jgi:hypothetical protein
MFAKIKQAQEVKNAEDATKAADNKQLAANVLYVITYICLLDLNLFSGNPLLVWLGMAVCFVSSFLGALLGLGLSGRLFSILIAPISEDLLRSLS